MIIKFVQGDQFTDELNCLKIEISFNSRGKLIPLNPFLDNQGIMRVGGRLIRAELPENKKHPILLPSNHHIARINIQNEHVIIHHPGALTTLYSIRENYRPLIGRTLTRKITQAHKKNQVSDI